MRFARGTIRWKGNSCEASILIPGAKTKGGNHKREYWYEHIRPGMTKEMIEERAEAWLAQKRLEFYEGSYVPSNRRRTVGDAITAWLADAEERFRAGDLAEDTIRWYRDRVNLHLLPLRDFCKIRLADVKPGDLSRVYTALRAKGLSESSVAGVHRVLRAVFNYAIGERWIIVNPANHVKNPPDPAGKPRPVLDFETAQELLRIARAKRIYSIMLTVLFTGLRISEVLGLMWDDLDFERGLIIVRRQLKRFGPGWTTKDVKTRFGYRVVPMPAELAEEFRKVREIQEMDKAENDYTDYGFVFATAKGQPLDRHRIYKEFKRVLAKAGLPGLENMREHDLRGTFASLVHSLGGDLKLLADLLGHGSEYVASRHYVRTSMDIRKATVDRLGKTLKNPKKRKRP